MAERSGARARELNELIRYTMWSVFRVADRGGLGDSARINGAAEVAAVLDEAAGKDVVTRGSYDLQGLRGGRRLHVLVGGAVTGRSAGGLRQVPPDHARPRE